MKSLFVICSSVFPIIRQLVLPQLFQLRAAAWCSQVHDICFPWVCSCKPWHEHSSAPPHCFCGAFGQCDYSANSLLYSPLAFCSSCLLEGFCYLSAPIRMIRCKFPASSVIAKPRAEARSGPVPEPGAWGWGCRGWSRGQRGTGPGCPTTRLLFVPGGAQFSPFSQQPAALWHLPSHLLLMTRWMLGWKAELACSRYWFLLISFHVVFLCHKSHHWS